MPGSLYRKHHKGQTSDVILSMYTLMPGSLYGKHHKARRFINTSKDKYYCKIKPLVMFEVFPIFPLTCIRPYRGVLYYKVAFFLQ